MPPKIFSLQKETKPARLPTKKREPGRKRVLNVGSGPAPVRLHDVFASAEWQQITLDANPSARPDLIGSPSDMKRIVGDGEFDAVWSSHSIEHLRAHEVLPSLAEFVRVLVPTGFAL